jgi:hypothetical protein
VLEQSRSKQSSQEGVKSVDKANGSIQAELSRDGRKGLETMGRSAARSRPGVKVHIHLKRVVFASGDFARGRAGNHLRQGVRNWSQRASTANDEKKPQGFCRRPHPEKRQSRRSRERLN